MNLPRFLFPFVAALVLAVGGSLACAEESRYLDPADFSGAIRVACVGDSITYGANIVERERDSYPAVLGRCLGSKFDVRNFGANATTLLNKGDLPYRTVPEFKQATDFAPHVVIIQLGTNDSKPHNWAHKDEFAADLRSLIAHFAALPTRPRIWLCRPVPVYEDRWGINEATVCLEIIPLILPRRAGKKSARH